MGILEDAGISGDTSPAGLDRQKSILDRKPPPQRAPTDYYRDELRRKNKQNSKPTTPKTPKDKDEENTNKEEKLNPEE